MLTVDWPLDRFGHGDIALRVRPEDWSEAELLLSNLDDRHEADSVPSSADDTSPDRAPGATVGRGSSPYESRLTV